MTALRVIGIDPGPVPGLVLLDYFESGCLDRAEAMQCTPGLLPDLLEELVEEAPGRTTLLQVERFVVGRRSSRSSTSKAGETTRELIGAVNSAVLGYDVRVLQRNAGQVKPWAMDVRLQAVIVPGDKTLWTLTAGMRHARDAARHALFAAVHDGGIPDPLSRGARV